MEHYEPISEEQLRKLELHETFHIDKWVSVLRVVDGWIYEFTIPPDEGNDFGVFVPEIK